MAQLHEAPASHFERYALGAAYDEMFTADAEPREHYRSLFERLGAMSVAELQQRQYAAARAFLNQGITFTVYGDDEGTEKIFPYDLLPRIIPTHEWDVLERGLKQRITALNLFIKDVYHDGHILRDRVVPRELIRSCKHYRRQMEQVKVPRDVYVAVVGSDLIRMPDGSFAVLEDNLCVPSGVSYMLANRQVMKQVFPRLVQTSAVRPNEHYGQGSTLESVKKVG